MKKVTGEVMPNLSALIRNIAGCKNLCYYHSRQVKIETISLLNSIQFYVVPYLFFTWFVK